MRSAAAVLVAGMAAALLSGCPPLMPRALRPATFALETEAGLWRLEGVDTAVLERSGWRLRVIDSAVSAASDIPYLERLELEVTNTSATPLELRPGRIRIAGFEQDARLGPSRPTTVGRNESVTVRYDPGLRAPELPHPFRVSIRVFRADGTSDSCRLILY
ncbi:MAG: hypothetical protein KGY99_05200 [Phycisphaerae bacterium]|nr:hypothetical protein [Phycisphaerae bacterium]